MPAGVWARSVSASEIEVNWQALSNSPERVLGYEVHFSLLNGNRNHTHTQHDSNACQRPCRSFEPSLTAKIIQFFVAARQENISECFQREQKEKTPVHKDLFVQLSAIGVARRRRSSRLYCSPGVAQTVAVAVAGNDPVAVDKLNFQHKQFHFTVQI